MDPNDDAYPGWFVYWRPNSDGTSNDENSIQFYMRDNEGGNSDGFLQVVSQDEVTSSDWVHLAATYDGTADGSGVKLYLNGSELATDVTNKSFTTSSTNNNTAPFNIGGRNDTGGLNGLTDEVGVWDRELTQSDVQSVMTAIPEPGSVLLLALGGLALLRRPRRWNTRG